MSRYIIRNIYISRYHRETVPSFKDLPRSSKCQDVSRCIKMFFVLQCRIPFSFLGCALTMWITSWKSSQRRSLRKCQEIQKSSAKITGFLAENWERFTIHRLFGNQTFFWEAKLELWFNFVNECAWQYCEVGTQNSNILHLSFASFWERCEAETLQRRYFVMQINIQAYRGSRALRFSWRMWLPWPASGRARCEDGVSAQLSGRNGGNVKSCRLWNYCWVAT